MENMQYKLEEDALLLLEFLFITINNEGLQKHCLGWRLSMIDKMTGRCCFLDLG